MAQVDPRDMLNNFCFHVYAQKSLFIAENCNGIFWDILNVTLSCEFRVHRAGSQLKIFRTGTVCPRKAIAPMIPTHCGKDLIIRQPVPVQKPALYVVLVVVL